MSNNYNDTENYCKDCDRSIYGKYPSCDTNIENNGKYTKPGMPCYCKCREGVGMVEKYPWEKGEPMEKSRAIDLLDNLIGMIEDNQDNDYDTAFRMAIEALKAQLSQEGTTSDLISRQAAIDTLKNRWKKTRNYEGIGDDIAEECELYLKQVPSAQPERTCVNCGRTVNNGGWYADGGTRCPIEEHYALPKDGYCHLWEKRNVTDDDYPERREK